MMMIYNFRVCEFHGGVCKSTGDKIHGRVTLILFCLFLEKFFNHLAYFLFQIINFSLPFREEYSCSNFSTLLQFLNPNLSPEGQLGIWFPPPRIPSCVTRKLNYCMTLLSSFYNFRKNNIKVSKALKERQWVAL